MSVHSVVTVLGEILWDNFLVEGTKRAGGASANVAYRLSKLGTTSKLISAVGDDPLGKELLQFFDQGMDISGIQTISGQPSGLVDVITGKDGHTFTIHPAAWDHIQWVPELSQQATKPGYIVFNSLALRHEQSRSVIWQFLEQSMLSMASEILFDVNVRLPLPTAEVLIQSLQLADMLKISNDELQVVAKILGYNGMSDLQVIEMLYEKFELVDIFLTLGSYGASYLESGAGKVYVPGRCVTICDTVGCGDTFNAGLISLLIAGESRVQAVEFANTLATVNALHQGATADFSDDDFATVEAAPMAIHPTWSKF